jgi:hypothetical protein
VPAELEDEDRVRPARRARLVVVLGGDRHDLSDRRGQPACGRADDHRISRDRLHVVVIAVLMGDQQKLSREVSNRGIVELEPAISQRREVAEWVNRNSPPALLQHEG